MMVQGLGGYIRVLGTMVSGFMGGGLGFRGLEV